MSRNNTIAFIREDIFTKVDEALGLGLDWTDLELVPSKYYAYRGLYMTDGIDVVHDDLVLNEKTVIVIKNDGFDLKGLDLITVTDSGIGKIPVDPYKTASLKKMKVTANLFIIEIALIFE
jgi:hypothetical protein